MYLSFFKDLIYFWVLFLFHFLFYFCPFFSVFVSWCEMYVQYLVGSIVLFPTLVTDDPRVWQLMSMWGQEAQER